ncbi:MAG: L-serine ammonia-lyase, iron-sulfur-dependent, subunit alpha [Coprococcus sp.]
MDFKKAAELLSLCKEYDKPISQIMMDRECEMTEKPLDEIRSRMAVSLQIMKDATKEAINQPSQSMGGLIGGESRKLSDLQSSGKNIAGNLISKAIAYSMGVLEVNASMGLIVAAPTAGSSGVIPGVLLALQEEYDFTDDQIIDALFTCSAIGYLAMLNATVAGAVGGCQAEIGVAAAMAAAAVVELMGGTPEQCTDAASTVLMNMLGLVCDPVGGLVEYPCQNRNASGASNAIVAAEISLAGIHQLIPLDEMMDIMYTVGKKLPVELRETALGGCALSPSACAKCKIKH